MHRFSKTQQDSLLAAVEDRTVTLLAATTENPYFSVISPLLSRCVLLTLQPLDDAAVRSLVRRAVSDERGLGGAVTLAADAEDHLVRLAAGDVRKALTALEAAAGGATATGAAEIDLATAEKAVDVALRTSALCRSVVTARSRARRYSACARSRSAAAAASASARACSARASCSSRRARCN